MTDDKQMVVARRHLDEPRPGYFKVRAFSRGPWLAARICRPCACTIGGEAAHEWSARCDRFPPLSADIAGKTVPIEDVWMYGREIDAFEHAELSNAIQ